jgi:hypothetical protein
MSKVPTVTYKHLIANSTVHLQRPSIDPEDPSQQVLKTVVFAGKAGGVGFYSTDEAWEQKQLDWLAKHPQVQVERVEATLVQAIESPVAEVLEKAADPAIAEAAADALHTAEAHASPERAASQETLAALIARTKQ